MSVAAGQSKTFIYYLFNHRQVDVSYTGVSLVTVLGRGGSGAAQSDAETLHTLTFLYHHISNYPTGCNGY